MAQTKSSIIKTHSYSFLFLLGLWLVIGLPSQVYAEPCSPLKLGDINGDRSLDAGDAQMTAQYVDGALRFTPCQLIAADVDKNGIVNLGDALLIAAHKVGLIKSLPAIMGNVTGLGYLNTLDGSYIQGYVNGTRVFSPWQRALSDVNGDGVIDSRDVQLIQQAIVGQVKLPIPLRGSFGIASRNN